jgi:excinuclease ABC subunit A
VIDMGPGAGDKGGRIVAQGAPATIADEPAGMTGTALRRAAQAPVAG